MTFSGVVRVARLVVALGDANAMPLAEVEERDSAVVVATRVLVVFVVPPVPVLAAVAEPGALPVPGNVVFVARAVGVAAPAVACVMVVFAARVWPRVPGAEVSSLADTSIRGGDSAATCDRVSAVGDRLSDIGDRPSVIGDRLSDIGDRLSVIGDRSSAISDRPSAIGNRCSAIGDRLSVIGDRSSTTGARPSVIGDRSSAIGDRPSVIGDRLSAIGNRSSATVARPSTIGDRSSTIATFNSPNTSLTPSIPFPRVASTPCVNTATPKSITRASIPISPRAIPSSAPSNRCSRLASSPTSIFSPCAAPATRGCATSTVRASVLPSPCAARPGAASSGTQLQPAHLPLHTLFAPALTNSVPSSAVCASRCRAAASSFASACRGPEPCGGASLRASLRPGAASSGVHVQPTHLPLHTLPALART